MNDITMELYSAWKSGQEEIVWNMQRFTDLVLSSHDCNENCTSPKHDVELESQLSVLMTGHFATYRDTLKIMVRK